MTQFIAFAFYLCISCVILIAVPLAMHPTMQPGRKALLIGLAFILFVPGGLALYVFLGAPGMASL